MTEIDEVSATEWLKENGPATDDEANATARALLDARDLSAAIDQLEELTDFEVELAERAYEMGRREILDDLDRALGKAAATADVAALRATVGTSRRLEIRLQPPFARVFADQRAAHLVAGARRMVERLAADREKGSPS